MSETEQLHRQIFALERRIAALERLSTSSSSLTVSTDNVSNPPTYAELVTAFGTPAVVGEGYTALVDDNNAETTVWLCVAIGTTWWYVGLTNAL